jgi:hypothetical protein
MPEVHIDAVDTGGDGDAVDEELVERERAKLREFVAGLSPDEIKSGGWFTKLSAQAPGLLHRQGRLAVLPGAVRGRTRGCHR